MVKMSQNTICKRIKSPIAEIPQKRKPDEPRKPKKITIQSSRTPKISQAARNPIHKNTRTTKPSQATRISHFTIFSALLRCQKHCYSLYLLLSASQIWPKVLSECPLTGIEGKSKSLLVAIIFHIFPTAFCGIIIWTNLDSNSGFLSNEIQMFW